MNEMNFAEARHNMVEQQVRTWTVLDPQVLDAMEHFPREDYVPQEYRRMSYVDIAIPLARDQEMMHPKVEAHLLQAVSVQPSDKILEIGTGSGCITAMLATLGKHVDSVDIFPEFQKSASEKLKAHGLDNVTMIEGDASKGWGNPDQYDVIVITGSLPELPQQFVDALAVDGRLFAVIGEDQTMEAISIHRSHGDFWEEKSLFETELPVLVNAEKPPVFEF